jgi:hypothetical protein
VAIGGCRLVSCVVALAAVTSAASAVAQPGTTPPSAPRPPPDPAPDPGARRWADGVSETAQGAALALYDEGNTEYRQSRFAQALAKYRQAIAHWDHPAIRFNMAVCLINLEEPLDARVNLERALAYGAAPLGEDVYRQGLTYRKLLDTQLTRVTIRCSEPGAAISVDGVALFTGPGEASPFLKPGDHQVVATKPGFLTASETLSLLPGKQTTYEVQLIAFRSATTMVRRWSRWKPYAVVGAGVAIAAVGAYMYGASVRSFDRFDRAVADACPTGCNAEQVAAMPDLHDLEDRAELQQNVAISLFAVGGAVVATGAVGLYLNQPRAQLAPTDTVPSITPTPGGATFSVRWGF